MMAPFALPYCVAFLVLGAYWSGADWAFRSVIWVFVAALFADVIVGAHREGTLPAADVTSSVFTRPWLIIQVALIVTGLHAVVHAQTMHMLFVACIAVGTTGGMFGIPVAHELMHRRNRVDRFLAEMLMTLFSYTHFCIEHVEGHHRNVGTPADPATARFGESLYAFLPRTVFGGFAHAWRLKKARMLRYSIVLCMVYASIAVVFGRWGVAFFALQGAVSVLLIETLNYIEHYGLTRRAQEGVDYHHAWDAGHAVSGWLLFNVTRHSDHHVHPHKHYLSLEGRSEAPQLPAGYFSLFVLALFPPLWRKVIDPRLDRKEPYETLDPGTV